MKSFTFNEVTSESLGLIIKNMPPVPRAERDIEILEISGKNGSLHIDNKAWKSKEYEIECVCTDLMKKDLICATLWGTHKLTLSDYPDRYFIATIKNQIDFETYLTYLQSFPLELELQPIAYDSSETAVTKTANGTFTVAGNVDVAPKITITGVGTVTINGYLVTVAETGITIDCELMQCYNGLIAKNDKVLLDEFPMLSVGSNSINLGTGITKVEIKYRKGWL